MAGKLKLQRTHITECLTHHPNPGETGPKALHKQCEIAQILSIPSKTEVKLATCRSFPGGCLRRHARARVAGRPPRDCPPVLRGLQVPACLAPRRRRVTRARRSALGHLLRAPAPWWPLRRRSFNAWESRAGCRSLSLMQESSAVVGEVSAGAVLPLGPGAYPSFLPTVPIPFEPQPCPGTR